MVRLRCPLAVGLVQTWRQEEGAVVQGLDEPWQSPHTLGSLSCWRAARASKQPVWPVSGFLVPCRRESPAAVICHFLFRW